MNERLLKLKEVIGLTGLSKSTIDRKEAANEFPKRVKLGSRWIAWPETKIKEWIQKAITEAGGRD
jgi:prophage regulatory protein